MDSEDPFCRRSDRSELSVESGARKEEGLKTQGDGTLGGGRIGGKLGGTDGKEQTPI